MPDPDATVIAVDVVGAAEIVPPPQIEAAAKVFVTNLKIGFPTPAPGTHLRYTLDGSKPTRNSKHGIDPLTIEEDTTLRVRLFRGEADTGSELIETFTKVTPKKPNPYPKFVRGVRRSRFPCEDKTLPLSSARVMHRTEAIPAIGLPTGEDISHTAFIFRFLWKVPKPELYTFELTTDGHASVTILHETQIVNETLEVPVTGRKSLALAEGLYIFWIEYLNYEGDGLFEFKAGPANGELKPLLPTDLFRDIQ
jgi:hypothetical protein